MCPALSTTPASRSPGAIILPAVQATADMVFEPATRPTMYFIGVTTGKSSIMSVFPKWAAHLGLGGGLSGGLGEVALRGIDCKWHDDPAVYRRVVQFIKNDPLSLGALVTTHKIDLLTACRDLFDTLDPHAELLGEISSISKQRVEGVPGNHVLLVGHAKDMITSGLSLESFLPDGHWTRSGADAVILGAGGSSIALSCALLDRRHGDNVPRRQRPHDVQARRRLVAGRADASRSDGLRATALGPPLHQYRQRAALELLRLSGRGWP